jgi:Response regulator containing a CheY-like receiver domain and an HTH DNA-binding domain
MKPEIEKMHLVWNKKEIGKTYKPTLSPPIRLDELMGCFFTSGPFAYFVIDFYDMSLSHISSSIEDMFGIPADRITLDDILARIHEDDMAFVVKAEEKSIDILYNSIGRDKVTRYKSSYCFRAKMADGSYQLLLHQALTLTTDENGRFGKTLNILTNIQHLTTENNYKLSLIGVFGEPSYLNIDADVPTPAPSSTPPFTKRETELIALIAAGYTNKEIADKLAISIETVKNHRKKIMNKAGVKTSAELISRCIRDGVI